MVVPVILVGEGLMEAVVEVRVVRKDHMAPNVP